LLPISEYYATVTKIREEMCPYCLHPLAMTLEHKNETNSNFWMTATKNVLACVDSDVSRPTIESLKATFYV